VHHQKSHFEPVMIARKTFISFTLLSLLAAAGVSELFAANGYTNEPSGDLQAVVDNVAGRTHQKFKSGGLGQNDFAATVISLRDRRYPIKADYRGAAQIYPASVVKLFYMSFYFRLLEDGKMRETSELKRGLRDMIVDSGNEATGYILDALTGTTSGPELPQREFAAWSWKRNAVNRYFASLGYGNININQKTHCEDAYGVEQQFRSYKGENRNMLTTNATARLLKEIVTGESISRERSLEMMRLLRRDKNTDDAGGFKGAFMADALEPGTKLWAKAGFTSRTRHDAVYIETPDNEKLVIVVFTEGQSENTEIIPFFAKNLLDGIKSLRNL